MRTLIATVLLLTGLTPAASASICTSGPSHVWSPVRVAPGAVDAGDFGVLPNACAGSEVSLGLGARLTIALEEFYGGGGKVCL